MLRTLFLTGTAAVLTIGTALAIEPAPGAKLGTTATEISTALGADGYDMTLYEKRRDGIAIRAIKEDRRLDLTVDPSSGEVVAMESRLRRGPDPRPGVDDDQIRTSLVADGYDIIKYERERGEIEVYASKDGRRYELKLDPKTDEILKIEGES